MHTKQHRDVTWAKGGGAAFAKMGAGASVKRSPSSLQAEIDKLRERELNTKVRKHVATPGQMEDVISNIVLVYHP